jgi:hypothetical protein
VQEGFTRWKNVFNWTVSYRRHSTVFTPYGMFQPNVNASRINPSIYPATNRDKMAYAVISRCAEDAERYTIVDEISKYIEVDYFGECGNLKCEIEANSCRDYAICKRVPVFLCNIIPTIAVFECQSKFISS